MLLVAINPGTFQEMVPLLALCLWKNENYNIGIRKILEIDKSKLLFGGRLWFWFSPPETERGPVWFYPEEAQAQPCLLKLELQCYLPWRIRFHAGMIHPSWSQRACCWPAWLQLCFWWHTQGVNLPQPFRVSHPEEHGTYRMCPDGSATSAAGRAESPRCPMGADRGWAEDRDPALLLSRSLFMPVVTAEMLSRKVFWGTFSNSN